MISMNDFGKTSARDKLSMKKRNFHEKSVTKKYMLKIQINTDF